MDDKEKKKQENIKIALIIVIVILVIVITLGLVLAFQGEAEKAAEEDKEKKRKRLQELEIKIKPLAKTRSELAQREKTVFLGIRFLVGLGIVVLNVLLWYYFNTEKQLGQQVTYNEAALLIYSFIAFILSGTPTKFMLAMKKGATSVVKIGKKHILTELVELEKERDSLKAELGLINQHEVLHQI